MTDLQRLHDWIAAEASEASKLAADNRIAAECRPDWVGLSNGYSELARILSVLLRVREGCRIRYWCEDEAKDGSRYASFMVYQENGTEPLRDLAELLEGK